MRIDHWFEAENLRADNMHMTHEGPSVGWPRLSRRRESGGNGPGPLRGNDHPYGLPNLGASDRGKVQIANSPAAFRFSVLLLCRDLRIPCAIENPAGRRLWQLLVALHCESLSNVSDALHDFCQSGTP